MKTPFPVRPLSAGIRSALLCSTLLLPMAAPVHAAADEGAVRQYHLSKGDLGQALTRFAAEAGIVLSFDPALTRGHRTEGLEGSYNVPDALARLLAGSDLQAVQNEDGHYTLMPRPSSEGALEMGATTVLSNQLGTITEGSGSYTPGTIASATRLVLSPRETPQTVNVMTRQQMDDFALNSIDDVMKRTPGVTVQKLDSERSAYWARGSQITNFQYDGIPSYLDTAYADGKTLSDMAIYDRIEVIKGATGLLTGSGQPGAPGRPPKGKQ